MVKLLALNLWVTLLRCWDLFWVIWLDYSRSLPFLRADLRLWFSYVRRSPYAISKAYLLSKGAQDPYTYGHTPIRALRKIAKFARITSADRVYELGCGPGRTCLWLHHRIGCHVVGIERIPTFVAHASSFDGEFLCRDFCTLDFRAATVVYLYGSCLSVDERNRLQQALGTLPPGARVITVSYPLDPPFQVTDTTQVRFPWGRADVYLNLARSQSE